ncbi:MAG: hypothetical protein FWE50_01950 [Alphaproteobacteria bacterium]|nr:hypothetical protein [Alphaproteobacteria bacterium]
MKFAPGIFLSLFFTGNLLAAQVVDVDFIHQYISQKHDIDIPIKNSAQQHWAANMEYLLCTIDVANEGRCNNTNYCASPYSTQQAVDTVAAINGINSLITANLCSGSSCDANQMPCSFDIVSFGTIRRCIGGFLSCDTESCPSDGSLGSCGCPPGTMPDGNGSCTMPTPCTNGQQVEYQGKICTCVSNTWQCNTNCSLCDTSCGCPAGQIPDGNGNCMPGTEKCTPGQVQYLLQGNGTILAVDCPLSGFRNDCPPVDNKVPCSSYDNRGDWGDAYIEDCCTTNEEAYGFCYPDAFINCNQKPAASVCKADAFGGSEFPFINITGKTHQGRRIVYVKESDGQLTVSRGQCRRMYYNNVGSLNVNSCQQKAVNVGSVLGTGSNYNNDYCTNGMEMNALTNKYFCDFPL